MPDYTNEILRDTRVIGMIGYGVVRPVRLRPQGSHRPPPDPATALEAIAPPLAPREFIPTHGAERYPVGGTVVISTIGTTAVGSTVGTVELTCGLDDAGASRSFKTETPPSPDFRIVADRVQDGNISIPSGPATALSRAAARIPANAIKKVRAMDPLRRYARPHGKWSQPACLRRDNRAS